MNIGVFDSFRNKLKLTPMFYRRMQYRLRHRQSKQTIKANYNGKPLGYLAQIYFIVKQYNNDLKFRMHHAKPFRISRNKNNTDSRFD